MTTPSPTMLQMFGRVFTRAFHASPASAAGAHGHSRARLKGLLEDVPPYPFPIKNTFKQSWFGLYGGKHIQFGNNVGPTSNFKTRRRWLPNVRHKGLYSQALGKTIELNVTANVLRTIDKVGGLDRYLIGSKTARLKELGPMGWSLRWKVMNTPWYKKHMEAEMEALGLTGTGKPIAEAPAAAPVEAAKVVKETVQEKAQETVQETVQEKVKEEIKETTPPEQAAAADAQKPSTDEAGNIKL